MRIQTMPDGASRRDGRRCAGCLQKLDTSPYILIDNGYSKMRFHLIPCAGRIFDALAAHYSGLDLIECKQLAATVEEPTTFSLPGHCPACKLPLDTQVRAFRDEEGGTIVRKAPQCGCQKRGPQA